MERKNINGVAIDEWGRKVHRVKIKKLLSRDWLETSTRLQGSRKRLCAPQNLFFPFHVYILYIYVMMFLCCKHQLWISHLFFLFLFLILLCEPNPIKLFWCIFISSMMNNGFFFLVMSWARESCGWNKSKFWSLW